MTQEELVDKALDKLKAQRKGSKVFCVRCGATGKRSPLRRWHNSYICTECWKVLRTIGEEEFLKQFYDEGEQTDGND